MTKQSLESAIRLAVRHGWLGRKEQLQIKLDKFNAEDEAEHQYNHDRRRALLMGNICPMCHDKSDEPNRYCVRCDHLLSDQIGCQPTI